MATRPLGVFTNFAVSFVLAAVPTRAADTSLADQAAQALRRASDYFDQQVSCEGGYLWHYSADLTRREGEGEATATQVWTQSPGTPAMGLAYLAVYERTADKHYLGLAHRAAMALVRGQLHSGGWDYRIEFDPKLRSRYAYRVDGPPQGKNPFNVTTLDDNTTQNALRLLMRYDTVTEFKDRQVHEAVDYALNKLIEAQYPNGAWAQRFSAPPNPVEFPVKRASYPESWSRTFEGKKYNSHYTFNDAAMLDVIDVMFEATRTYQDSRYRTAAEKAGDFIILAQMPEPQPTWAQQYDADMHPAWARKFEPPSVTGGESQKILETLMNIYRQTGEKRFLEPIPPAVAWFKRSLLPDGKLARFYELQSNRPLYFNTKYELIYDDSDLPTHYGFKIGSNLARIEKAYAELTSKPWQPPQPPKKPNWSKPSAALTAEAKAVIAALDSQGRWLVRDQLRYQKTKVDEEPILTTQMFMKNIDVLSRYLAAVKSGE